MKTAALVLGTLGLLSACSEKANAPTTAAPVSSLPGAAGSATAAPAAAPQSPAAAATATTSAPRSVPLNVQGVASAGVTVRVKGIEMGVDATVLKVSISYASRIASSTTMALTDTFLEDDKGNRLMLKRPENNRDLSIRDGDTMEGDLVFLGAVAAGATTLKLVFNDSNQPDNVAGPGLVMTLPLPVRT